MDEVAIIVIFQGSELHLTLGILHEIVKRTFLGGCPSSPPADANRIIFFRIISKTMFQKLIHVFFSKIKSIQLSYEFSTLVVLDT